MALDGLGDIKVIVEPDNESGVLVTDTGVEIDNPDGSVTVRLGPPPSEGADADEDPKEFYKNLCAKIGDDRLSIICEDLIEQIQADDNSRKETLEIRGRGMGLLGLKLEQPKAGVGDDTSSSDGMSVVVNPLLLEGCIKSWANAQAELLPADGPCKVEDFDPDEPQANQQLADDFERDMNFYLTDIATEYGPETSHMLLWGTTFGGCGIKKVHISPELRRPTSPYVDIKDFIVSDTTKDLKACERLTHRIEMRPSRMKRLQMKGYYRDIPLSVPSAPETNAVDARVAGIQGVSPTPDRRPEDQPYTLYETQCELNIPEFAPKEFAEKEIPLPYLVTIEKDSRVILSIRRDWKPEDEECIRRQMYVKYPYVPGPGFYGTGLLNILGNSSAAMTAAWRMALDAGMYANFMGGVVSEIGSRQKTMTLTPKPGEFTQIQTNGRPITDVITMMPYKDVTAGLLSLIDKITAQSEKAAGAVEVPVKEGVKDIPVGTMLAYIEQASQMMAAAHKGMHRAQSEELTLIADLFREDPESFTRGNKKFKNQWTEQRLFLALKVCTLVPKSDPNVPSHVHRLMKALGLIQLLEIPQFSPLLDAGGVLDRVLKVMKEDPNGIRKQPPPPSAQPSPEAITAGAKAKDAETRAEKVQVDAAKVANDSKDKARQQDASERIETLKLAQSTIAHAADNKKLAADTAHKAATHGLAVAQAVNDSTMDHAQLALDTHTALNPPEPAADKGTQ